MQPIRLSERHTLGPGFPCFIIAEAGVNHNGDLALARRLITCAAEAGADAIKFQSFKADLLASPDAPKAAYQLETTDAAETQHEMLRRLELAREDHELLQAACAEAGILFLSTPFDAGSADLLAALDVSAFKVSSGDLTNLPLLEHIARLGRPMLVSTGMATLDEVGVAVQGIRQVGNPPLALLHCVSCYPAAPGDANLRAINTMADAFAVPVGYSDHTPGRAVALAAVALGACIIEKHLTLDRNLPGPDHRASLEPHELRALVAEIRNVEAALGDGCKVPALAESDTRMLGRRSLVATQDIPAGTILTAAMLGARRPGTGIPPTELAAIVGRVAQARIPAGTLLRHDLVL